MTLFESAVHIHCARLQGGHTTQSATRFAQSIEEAEQLHAAFEERHPQIPPPPTPSQPALAETQSNPQPIAGDDPPTPPANENQDDSENEEIEDEADVEDEEEAE